MSRQNKQVKLAARAKEITDLHKNGQRGPKSTTPKHDKKKTKWNSPETKKARAAVLRKFNEANEQETVLDQLNEKKEKVKLGKKGQQPDHGVRDLKNKEIEE
jgi:hypothetical protein